MAAPDSSFLLQQAIDLHQRGAYAEARRCCIDIVRREPRNADALYLLGLTHCHLGELSEAIKRLRKAVSVAPLHADAHNTLSLALREIGRPQEALASCEAAIASDPGFAEAHGNRGDILQDLQRPQEALDAYDQALALDPGFVPALVNRGSVLQQFERHQEAVASYDRATALAPELAEAWLNRSGALRALERWDEALDSCERAIAAQPDFAPAHLAHGVLLKDRRRFEDAAASLDRALALHPDLFPALELQVEALYQAGALERALAAVAQALALKPDFARGHAWRGAILIKQNRAAEAVAALDRALAMQPNLATAHVDRGLALHALGRYDEAFAALEYGSRLEPGDAHIQFVVGLTDLLHGRWQAGFARYERRLEVPQFNLLHRRLLATGRNLERRFDPAPIDALPQAFPRWDGRDTDGEPILIETEQGMGDCIQFAGFAAHLAKRGHRVRIMTLPALVPLLRSLPGIEAVTADWRAESDPKFWLPLMSLPFVLKTTPATVPFEGAYLSAEPERIAAWRERLRGDGFKIGIAWQGNRQNWLDAGRSIPLAAFQPLATIAGVRLISLQKRPGAEQIDGFGGTVERVLDETDTGGDALLDTAAVLANLDLIVTSDSMMAHLAGALARPTFVALRRVPDWRWLLDRDDSPFYPTARLFRQESEGDWTPVFERIVQEVRARIAAGDGR